MVTVEQRLHHQHHQACRPLTYRKRGRDVEFRQLWDLVGCGTMHGRHLCSESQVLLIYTAQLTIGGSVSLVYVPS